MLSFKEAKRGQVNLPDEAGWIEFRLPEAAETLL